MSALFILEYAGSPVRFQLGGAQLVTEAEADRFIAEADAWITAKAHNLNLAHVRVINLYTRDHK